MDRPVHMSACLSVNRDNTGRSGRIFNGNHKNDTSYHGAHTFPLPVKMIGTLAEPALLQIKAESLITVRCCSAAVTDGKFTQKYLQEK